MTRDIYQKYIRPRAKTHELIYVTWLFVALLVLIGFIFAYTLKSINDVWGWIIMGLGAGALVPGFLRLYWWRFNGGGFAIGTIVGLLAAVLQRIVTPYLVAHYPRLDVLYDERWLFCIILAIGFAATVAGTYLTRPTDPVVLERFYTTTKPFGLWGPLKKKLPVDVQIKMEKEHFFDIVSLPFAITWQVSLFLLPMQLIVRNFEAFGVTLAIFVVSLGGLYLFWYRKLPPANRESAYD
jgi:Na+/proline symporter